MLNQETFKRILKLFNYSHLPEHLQETSKMFYNLAWKLYSDAEESTNLATNDQLYLCLQQLLISKDAAVRSKIAE